MPELMLFAVGWLVPLAIVVYVIYLLAGIRDAVESIDRRLADGSPLPTEPPPGS